ncbi:MAG: EamA family transporter [Chloroflexi bacterium]|nr:EamA family transporter [Chloroflexota bacterium]
MKTHTPASRRTGFLLTVLAAMLWSFTAPGIDYLLNVYHVPQLALIFWRDFFVVLVLLPITLRRFTLPARRDLLRFAIAGGLFIGVYHALWVFSVALNGSALAVVLIYLFPAFTIVGAWLLWRERPTRSAILGLGLAFIGCVLAVEAYNPEVLRLNWLGVACGLGTALTQAGYTLFSQRTLRNTHPWIALTWTMFFGTLVLALMQRPSTVFAVGSTPWPWLVLCFLGIGPTLGGYIMYNLALRSLPAGVVGTVVMLEVPCAALLSGLLLNQWLDGLQLLGMACILGGAVLPQLGDHWRARRALLAERIDG